MKEMEETFERLGRLVLLGVGMYVIVQMEMRTFFEFLSIIVLIGWTFIPYSSIFKEMFKKKKKKKENGK